MIVIDSLCLEKLSAFESVSLSPRTVCHCIEKSDSVNDSLRPAVAQILMPSLSLMMKATI